MNGVCELIRLSGFGGDSDDACEHRTSPFVGFLDILAAPARAENLALFVVNEGQDLREELLALLCNITRGGDTYLQGQRLGGENFSPRTGQVRQEFQVSNFA